MGTWICPEILVVNIGNSQYYLLQSSYTFIYAIVASKFWVISFIFWKAFSWLMFILTKYFCKKGKVGIKEEVFNK